MPSRLNPYINFRGTAREALAFYAAALGGEVAISTFGEFGAAAGAEADQVMHGQLETPAGFTLMVSDLPERMEYRPGTNITISLSGDDAELRDYFARLAEGGTINTPLEKQMWGDEFGELTDKFGIRWLVNISGAPSS